MHHCNVTASFVGSLSVGIIFIAYVLQTKYQPFLPPNNDMLGDNAALTSGMTLIYVSSSYLFLGDRRRVGGVVSYVLVSVVKFQLPLLQ